MSDDAMLAPIAGDIVNHDPNVESSECADPPAPIVAVVEPLTPPPVLNTAAELPPLLSRLITFTNITMDAFSYRPTTTTCLFHGRRIPARAIATTVLQCVALEMAWNGVDATDKVGIMLRGLFGLEESRIELSLSKSTVPLPSLDEMRAEILTELKLDNDDIDSRAMHDVLDRELKTPEVDVHVHHLIHNQRNPRETLVQCMKRHASVDLAANSMVLQAACPKREPVQAAPRALRPWHVHAGEACPFSTEASVLHFGLEHVCFLSLVYWTVKVSCDPRIFKLLCDLWHLSYAMLFDGGDGGGHTTVHAHQFYHGRELFREVHARFRLAHTACPLSSKSCDIPDQCAYLTFSALIRSQRHCRGTLLWWLVRQSYAIAKVILCEGARTPMFIAQVHGMVHGPGLSDVRLNGGQHYSIELQSCMVWLRQCLESAVISTPHQPMVSQLIQRHHESVPALRKALLNWSLTPVLSAVENRCHGDRVLRTLWHALRRGGDVTVERAVYFFTASKTSVLVSTGASAFYQRNHRLELKGDVVMPLFSFDDAHASYSHWHDMLNVPAAFIFDYVELGSLVHGTDDGKDRAEHKWRRLIEDTCRTFATVASHQQRLFRARARDAHAHAPTTPHQLVMNRWRLRLLETLARRIYDAYDIDAWNLECESNPLSVLDAYATHDWIRTELDQMVNTRTVWSERQLDVLQPCYGQWDNDASPSTLYGAYTALIVFAGDFHDLFDICNRIQRWWQCGPMQAFDGSEFPSETALSRRMHTIADFGLRLGSKYAMAIPHISLDEERASPDVPVEDVASEVEHVRMLFETCPTTFAQCNLVRLGERPELHACCVFVPNLRQCKDIPRNGVWTVPASCRTARLRDTATSTWYLADDDLAMWTDTRNYQYAFFGSDEGGAVFRPWYDSHDAVDGVCTRAPSFMPCRHSMMMMIKAQSYEDYVSLHAHQCHEGVLKQTMCTEPRTPSHVTYGVYIYSTSDVTDNSVRLPGSVQMHSFPICAMNDLVSAKFLTPMLCSSSSALLSPACMIETSVWFTHDDITSLVKVLHPSLYHRAFHVIMCLEPLMDRLDWEAWKVSESGLACGSVGSSGEEEKPTDAQYLSGLCKNLLLCRSFTIADESHARYRQRNEVWDAVARDNVIDARVLCDMVRTYLCSGVWTARRFNDVMEDESESGVGTVRLACVAVRCYS